MDATPASPAPQAPRVISRAQHSVSRKDISRGALKVLYGLRDSGFRACLVGGAVRDLLLGGHPKDFDIATNATPEEVKRIFRNCRLIGRRFRLAHVIFGPEIVDVATFGGTGVEGEGDRHMIAGRIIRDNVWGTIEEDALRRDFRVNALYDIADFSVIDFVGGMEDLEQRRLHLIGDPELRYREDPVRMLRAARLAAKLGFTIDPTASAPFATLGHLLGEAPPARLFDETMKMFMAGNGLASLRMLEKCDLLKHLFPGTARALARDQHGALRSLVENGLAGTDARVREDKPVTPAFLFAVLLWGEVYSIARDLQAEGMDRALAWQRAAHKVMAEQTERVAIPRRFSYAMEEIWALQPRFAERTRKRVFRLLAHPRFRAAYDFLLLRAAESEDLRERGEWWTRIQTVEPEQLGDALEGAARVPASSQEQESGDTEPAGEPRKRRRRRGGRGRGRSKSESASPADDAPAE